MADGNTSATEIAPTQQTQPQTEADLISEIGQAFDDSLHEGEQPPKTEAKPAEAETPPVQEAEESTDEAESESGTEEQPEEDQEKQPATVKLDAKANALVTLEDGTEVPLKELISGSLRQQDYTRKTQEIASYKRQLEDAAHRFKKQDDQVKEFAEWAQKVVEKRAPKPPDSSKINTDPIGYLQEKEAFEGAVHEWRQLEAMKQTVSQRLEASEGAQTHEQLQQETKALVERMPALATPEGWRNFKAEATEISGKHFGFAPEEIEGINDHRYVYVLHKAMQMVKLEAKKMEAVRAAKNAPPPVTAGARPAPNRSTQQTQKVLTERARRTGSVEDIAALLGEV